MRLPSYNKLDEDGLIYIGARLEGAEAVVGKTVQVPGASGKQTRKDNTLFVRPTEKGVIDNIMLSTNEQGQKIAKVKVRSIRIPEVGDKIASRHGQKGTCGMTLRQEDMPFTCEGITPDVIINPHCIPSRMTIGQLIECILGKSGVMDGKINFATPFIENNVEAISEELHKHGYQKRGNEVLYNGFTGQKMDCQIFIGPTYYQRLKHMVDDKQHSRSTGPNVILTRQPVNLAKVRFNKSC
jgi:DNA-directed RNA polymerase II subunit RPB2